MKINHFEVERYFAKYEFATQYLLSSSDCDGYSMEYVLKQATQEERILWDRLHLGYTETKGSTFLRQAIQQYYSSIDIDHIVVSSPGEANFILMNILLEKGDKVVCMSPMYQSLHEVANAIGCNISYWKPIIKEGRWYYDPNDLLQLVNVDTRLVIINFPHNPTGFYPSFVDYQKIIDIVRKYNTPLFSDEMYRDLLHVPSAPLPPACDMYPNAISLWGMAKTFGMAGLRIGWVASQNLDLLNRIEAFKDYLSICNSATSEILATIALNHIEKFLVPNIEKIKSNLRAFEYFVNQNAKLIEYPKPSAGSTAFIKINTKKSSLEYAEKLIKETGIMLIPSEMFHFGTKHARIGFGRENFCQILNLWQNYIDKSNDL